MRIIFLHVLLCLSMVCNGQRSEFDHISSGNKLYKDSLYTNAAIEYQQAYKLNGNSFEAVFNLGNAMYKQDSLEAAIHQFQLASNMTSDKLKQAEAFHNLGNAFLKQKNYQKSIDAYKEALRRNSTDEETRYNLSYARKMLDQQNKDNQQNKDQNQQNKDQQKDQDKNEQKQNDQKDQNGQDQKDQKNVSKQDQKNNQGNDKKDQQKQPQSGMNKGGMKPEDAEKLLNALEQDESEIRKGIRLKEEQTAPKNIDKNW